jgi:hypothetical protein
MSRNRHKNKNTSNHPKPIKTLIDERSPYSPNSIGGRIDLESLRDKLFSEEQTKTNHNNNAENSKTSLQAKGEEK